MGRSRFRNLRDPTTLRGLVENLREGIYITTAEGEILDANPAFLEIFGVGSLAELRTLRATDLMAEPEQRRQELALLRRNGAVREFELVLRRPDGEPRTVLDTCYLVRDPKTGEPLFHGVLVDITHRKALEQRLRELTIRDPLTGCYNRRFLVELERRLEVEEQSWGAVIFDIDHFKLYNDRHGHQAGDAVLVRFARFLRQLARAGDPVIRIGGDEFLLLLAGVDAGTTPEVVARFQGKRGVVPVAFSLGWATRQGDESVETTIRRADQALLRQRARDRGAARVAEG